MKLAVVSHDAGGAELISSWLHQNENRENYRVSLKGPAVNIFQQKLKVYQNEPLNEVIPWCDWVLCGSSWQSIHERQALEMALSLAKKNVVFLDHWVNYLPRFILYGKLILPDEIWVTDREAMRIATHHFPDVTIHLKGNPYLDDLTKEFQQLPFKTTLDSTILYVTEPISEHAVAQHGDSTYWGYTEKEAICYFFRHISIINPNISNIIIRPHPSEKIAKYQWSQEHSPRPIQISQGRTLLEDLAETNIVVGCESMAMVVGLYLGKRVISSIPPGGRVCQLPFDKIEYLQFLVCHGKN